MPKNHKLGTESRIIFAAVLAVLFLVGCQTIPPTSANGPLCVERTALMAQLKAKPKSMGMAANGSVLEVLTTKSGTWSIIVTAPYGATCLIWFGEHWEDIKQQEVDPPS